MNAYLSCLIMCILSGVVFLPTAQAVDQKIPSPLPPLREQVTIHREWLKARLELVMP